MNISTTFIECFKRFLSLAIHAQRHHHQHTRTKSYQSEKSDHVKNSISRFLHFSRVSIARSHRTAVTLLSMPRSQVEANWSVDRPPTDTQNWKRLRRPKMWQFIGIAESEFCVFFACTMQTVKNVKLWQREQKKNQLEILQAIIFLINTQTVHWTNAGSPFHKERRTRMNYFYGRININSR